MLFKKNLARMYADAGFDSSEHLEEIDAIYREIRRDNVRAGVGERWPAHAMYPNYPHVENTAFSALETLVANTKAGVRYSDQDFMDLAIAGLGHDTGYRNGPVEHEKVGMEITGNFLARKGISSDRIKRITDAIGWTKVFGDKPSQETELGRLLAAGDALGMISDPKYFHVYLPLLFGEFNFWKTADGKTMNEVLGYRALDGAEGIRGPKSAAFVRKVLYPAVEPFMGNFDLMFGGEGRNPYRRRIQENLELLERNV